MVYTPTNWGLPFLLVVGLGGAVYFGGGYLHGKRTRGHMRSSRVSRKELRGCGSA